ncbi:PREDICTED: thaumatin-like protein 1 [Tarenaya hassleriana]|uniref:thaumatin-like protein 1 n=1 Tax=Tarenaya hassleriana TaxID=28532 RepID=UPI00053C7B25|nr:PREDICTED: thaumatin-like protein 1 [Tarenaya hassleriana]
MILKNGLFFAFFTIVAEAARFEVINNCQFTVWAASYAPAAPASGKRLGQGETWTLIANPGTSMGRIWGRTNCSFDASGRRGRCETGDCNGVLECNSHGEAPNTLAEYTLGGESRDVGSLDSIDISLVDGFNLPLEFGSSSSQCSQVIRCAGNIIGECPTELNMKNACNGPCAVFKTDEYCCTPRSNTCQPTTYSKFFKRRCPYTYSYPQDDTSATFTCPAGTNYTVIFCP